MRCTSLPVGGRCTLPVVHELAQHELDGDVDCEGECDEWVDDEDHADEGVQGAGVAAGGRGGARGRGGR